MNTLTTSEKSYLKYILSEILKQKLNVMYGEVDDEKVFISTSYVARVFDKNKVPFDLSKNFRDGTAILKKQRFLDLKDYKLTKDIVINGNKHCAKLVSESDASYIDADLLKRLGEFEFLQICEFKASNNLSVHYVFKDEELIGFIAPVRII